MGQSEAEEGFKVYGRRYAVLTAVVLLNISNAAIWITYATVSTTVADFYETETSKINWFSMCFMVTSIFFCFVSTFIVDRFGLRFGIYTGATLNMVGSIVKTIGTSTLIEDKDTQYAVSLLGQEIAAMGQSFVLFISTKVSQTWFPEHQRAISTTVMAMSNPFGIVVAEVVTPSVVQDPEDVPTNNIIWMCLAIVCFFIAIFSVNRTKPKTPPSQSAETGEIEREKYLVQLKRAFTNFAFIQLMVVLGGGIGMFSAVATLAEQMLCPLGYTDNFAGISIALMVLLGFAGSAVTGIYVDRTKRFLEVTKLFFGLAAIFAVCMFEFFLIPEKEVLLALSCALFGFFGVGAYPVGLELGVEATYPVEETISTAFIFLAGQITSAVIITIVPLTAVPQDPDLAYLNECSSDVTPLNYTYAITGLMIYLCLIVSFMILFMDTRYKRLEAERGRVRQQEKEPNDDAISLT